MKKNIKTSYLFVKNEKNEEFDLDKFSKFSDIHFWETPKITNFNNHIIYVYCKNVNEINDVLVKKYVPHITFIGETIFSPYYDETLDLNFERFWVIEKEQLNDIYIEKFLNLKNIESNPVAITFNPLFQKNISYDEFFIWIKKLNSKFKNPLYLKDLSLQNNEIFSKNNAAFINNEFYFVVLGLFGDYYFKEEPNSKILFEGIMKDKICMFCDNAEFCNQRGLGIIKYDNKIKSCIGIKLFQLD